MRYSLGTKEIIAIVFGTLGFIGISIVYEQMAVEELFSVYMQLRILWLAILAALFGPIAGVIIGAVGGCMFEVLMNASVSYDSMIAMAILGLFIGKYAKKYGIRDGFFGWKGALEFNMIQLMAGIFAWVFVTPFLDFFMNGSNLMEAEIHGMLMTAGNCGMIFVIGTPVLLLINQWMKYDKKRIAEKQKNKKDDGLLRIS